METKMCECGEPTQNPRGICALCDSDAGLFQSPAQANAAKLPGDWTVEWDAFSGPDTIRLNSPKWGGAFLKLPVPGDISLAAIVYHLLADCLAAPAAQKAEPSEAVDALIEAVGKLIKAKGRFHTEQNYAAVVKAYDAATRPA